MVEKEVDEKNATVTPASPYPKYVTDYQGIGPGGLIRDLGVITRISGGSINNLVDFHTYTVRAAVPFDNGPLTYTDGSGTAVKQITGGTVSIGEINGKGSLDLSTVINGEYEVIAVSVDASKINSWNSTSKTISDWSSFALEGAGTEIDYVFVKENTPSVFKMLNVKIETASSTIDIPAIQGITPPVAGEAPATTITETAQYTGTVTWDNDNPTVFAGSIIYKATITLSPKPGFTLTGVTANYFTVAGATTVTHAANSGVITAVFPVTDKTITTLAILGVTPPVIGATPVTTITETTQYTGTVTWDNGNPVAFAGGTVYTATITLTPISGFTLYGVDANKFTVAGTSSPAANAANTGVITAVFPATDATVSLDIPVPKPVTGAAPVMNVNTTQYSGTVTWVPAVPSGGTFAATTSYTATITITPKAGFTLTGVAANSFTVTGATTVSNAANSGSILAVFPATLAKGNLTISITFNAGTDISISPKVTSISYSDIASGTTPLVLTLNGTYTGVTWKLDDVIASGGTNTGLTIDNSSDLLHYLVPGIHRLDVKGTKDGKDYSDYIEFTITYN